MQELEDLEKLESMDLLQKSRVKWEDKFSCHDSPISFPPMLSAHRLSIADRDFLESMVSMDEIKAVVWDCVICGLFFSTDTFPHGSNSAFITLIPKVSNPLFIKDYRPISLIGIHYKIVAKILANRLSKVIDSIISPEQSAFITRRQILDGPLILSETIDWYKKRKKKMMLFKVDFEKAFDSVSWRYLDYVLDKLGFGIKWRNWIKAELASARTSILINGSPTSEFSLKRGLRQGDPLAPFLFIIVMEGLHMAFNDGLSANMFHGVKVGSPGIHLSHLFYAEYVIILSEWNLNSMKILFGSSIFFTLLPGLRLIFINLMYMELGFRLMSSEDFKKLAWIKWSNILSSLDKGGLGIGSLKVFNMSLLLKWRWHLFHNPNALWVHVVKAIHGDEAGLLSKDQL
ncbi:RNA-directed DNA polymerase, eukaryota, reverse transcriptase zinc-binding domain protein [Tanacetum coccineum]